MPKYYGCPCEGCGKPLTLQDDIVVCPDCGAPYHRVCYEKLGQCIHRPAHAAGYEWKFPYEESQLRTCPSCGERTLRDEETCRCCGAVLPPEGQEPPSSRGSGEETFDYSQMYRQFGTSADPEKEFFEDAFGKEAKMDGIDRQDWLDYIGPAAPAYLAAYSRMQLQKSKISMSFSALLFGPFYFFYRKAWKPAFGFLAAELLLAAPTFIEMLQLSGSALAPAMSASALTVFARVCSVLSFVLMLVRGMYGKWLYRKSAADHIRRIQSEFPDAQQRQAVLRAQGGVSFGLCDDITNAVIDEEKVVSPRRYHTITESKNGAGAVPIKTEKGWLHIAHGVRNTAAGLRYVIYVFVTALDDPSKVIAEPSGFLIAPRDWERVGDVSNVVFTNGAIADDDGSVYIYYAASDTRLHVASTTIDKLLDFAFNTPADPLRSVDCVKQRCALIDKNLEYLKSIGE